jgi:hypothetical protein
MSYGSSGTGNYGMSSGNNLGKGDKLRQMPNFTPEQMDLFKSMFSNVGADSFTGKLAAGDESTFNDIEAPAYRSFAEQQGGVASRFSGMGGTGARKSSGFQNTMTAGSSNLAQDLQSKRFGMQNQAIKDLMSMSQSLLNNEPYENYIEKKKPSFWEQMLGNFTSGIGEEIQGLPKFFSNKFKGGF